MPYLETESSKAAPDTAKLVQLQNRIYDTINLAYHSNTVAVTSHATPGTEFSLTHGLGRIPTGYLVVGKSAAGVTYDGTTPHTDTLLYLRCDTASVDLQVLVW